MISQEIDEVSCNGENGDKIVDYILLFLLLVIVIVEVRQTDHLVIQVEHTE